MFTAELLTIVKGACSKAKVAITLSSNGSVARIVIAVPKAEQGDLLDAVAQFFREKNRDNEYILEVRALTYWEAIFTSYSFKRTQEKSHVPLVGEDHNNTG